MDKAWDPGSLAENLTAAKWHLTTAREYLKATRRSLAAVRCSLDPPGLFPSMLLGPIDLSRLGWGASRVFLTPWSGSRLKKKNQVPEPLGKSQEPAPKPQKN